jgi:FkbM family methyltransferase
VIIAPSFVKLIIYKEISMVPDLSQQIFALPKIRILGREIDEAIVEIDGMRIFLNPNPERFMDKKLLSGELWEHKEVDLLRRIIKPGMTILDIGANFGYYSLLFSQWAGKNGRVIAFEPTSEYSNRLIRHIQENNLRNVRAEIIGLSDSNATCQISVGECSATIQWVWSMKPRTTETIQLVTLDSWWQQYIDEGNPDKLDFVKVDTDGHEPKFLLGARQVLMRHRPMILMEFFRPQYADTGYSCEQVADFLEKEWGYELCMVETGKAFDSRKALLEKINNEKLSCDILCIPQKNIISQSAGENTTTPVTVSAISHNNPGTSINAVPDTFVLNISPAMLSKARELVGGQESQAVFFILMSASEMFVNQAGKPDSRRFTAAFENINESKISRTSYLLTTNRANALTHTLNASAAFEDGKGNFDAASFDTCFNGLCDCQFSGSEAQRITVFYNLMRPIRQETVRIAERQYNSAFPDGIQHTSYLGQNGFK